MYLALNLAVPHSVRPLKQSQLGDLPPVSVWPVMTVIDAVTVVPIKRWSRVDRPAIVSVVRVWVRTSVIGIRIGHGKCQSDADGNTSIRKWHRREGKPASHNHNHQKLFPIHDL